MQCACLNYKLGKSHLQSATKIILPVLGYIQFMGEGEEFFSLKLFDIFLFWGGGRGSLLCTGLLFFRTARKWGEVKSKSPEPAPIFHFLCFSDSPPPSTDGASAEERGVGESNFVCSAIRRDRKV